MKKYNLFKVLAITVIVCWLLTLFIPGSYASYTGEITTDKIASVGIVGLFSNLSVSISYFNSIAIYLVAIACFYAVLSKLEVYENFVSYVASMFKSRIGLLITLSCIILGILGMIVSNSLILLVFVPFIYQVMKKNEIDKKVILSSTIIALLIGSMCGIYDSSLFSVLNLKVNTLLLVKIIMFVVIETVMILFLTKINHKEKETKKVKAKKETKKEVKKKVAPKKKSKKYTIIFGICLVLFTLISIGAIIPWESLISKCSVFTDFNTWLSKLKIGNYAVINNIIGSPVTIDKTTGSTTGVLAVFGSWQMQDMSIFLLILTIIIVLVKKIKVSEFISLITNAIKKVLPVAITAMLISIVLVIMVTTGVNVTIVNFIVSLFDKFNIATGILATIIGSVLTGDFYYFVSTSAKILMLSAGSTDLYGVIGLIMQSFYYFTMIIAPTSVGLIIGLYYLNIPYGKWFKFIWKLLLVIFLVILITTLIVFALV